MSDQRDVRSIYLKNCFEGEKIIENFQCGNHKIDLYFEDYEIAICYGDVDASKRAAIEAAGIWNYIAIDENGLHKAAGYICEKISDWKKVTLTILKERFPKEVTWEGLKCGESVINLYFPRYKIAVMKTFDQQERESVERILGCTVVEISGTTDNVFNAIFKQMW